MAMLGYQVYAIHACQSVAWFTSVEMGCITHNHSFTFPKQMSCASVDLQDKRLIALREVERRPQQR